MRSKRRAPESPGSDLDWGSVVESDINIADIEDGLRSCQLLSHKYGVLAEEFFSKLVGNLLALAPQQKQLVKTGGSRQFP